VSRALAALAAVCSALVLGPLSAAGVAAAPTVTFSCSPGPSDCTGWYRSDVTVRWNVDPSAINTEGCNTHTITADTTGSVEHCGAESSAGQWTRIDITVRVDKTPPQLTGAAAARGPDANGWYNHPVAVAFQGADTTSGVAGCTSVVYGGPDNAAASVAGSCTDNAGNTSAPGAFGLKYDSTPPSLKVSVGAGNGTVLLRWRVSPDTRTVTVMRTPTTAAAQPKSIYRGSGKQFRDRHLANGVRYRYTVTATDEAGNAATRVVGAVPTGPLRSPAAGARVSSPPLLRWRPVGGASYYNVQLYRGGTKILSTWPAGPHLQLARRWVYRGRRYRLAPGRYRWYVWPGFGARSASRYGRLLGASDFVVAG
jgi:hypothetical protein